MKNLFKLLTLLTVFSLFTGCILILPEDDDEYKITITNNTGEDIDYLYIVPESEYVEQANNWTAYYTYYETNHTDILGANFLVQGSSVEVDLANYSGSSFFVVAFEDYYIQSEVYKVYVTTSYTAATIETFHNIY